jgi:hypothetical protein
VATNRAEDYRARAKYCEERAAASENISTKNQYLELAEEWRRKAELQEEGTKK